MSPAGESKGFAHVDFANVEAADSIMQANMESQFFLDGRGLNLDYAGPPSSKPSFPPSNTLHFKNYSGDEAALQTALEEFAPVIKSIRISTPFCFCPSDLSILIPFLSAEPTNEGKQSLRLHRVRLAGRCYFSDRKVQWKGNCGWRSPWIVICTGQESNGRPTEIW